jgi:hypothetical protein
VSDGGFTLDFRTARPVNIGLAVCADPSRTLPLSLADWSDQRVLRWLRTNRQFVRSRRRGGLYLGGWHSAADDRVHLDVVRVLSPERLRTAQGMGRWHRQRAVFDLARRTVVALPVT